MRADIAQSSRAEQRVHYGMRQYVRIGVSVQAEAEWDVHAAQNQPASLCEAVHVVACADPHMYPAFHT